MIKVAVGNITHREEKIVDPSTTTLRQLLEQNNIDYAAGSPTLDGLTLKPGDLDKTFSEMNVREKCYLLVTMKQANAAKVQVLGGAAVVRSGIPLEVIKAVARYRPDYLQMSDYDSDGHKVPVFGICVTNDPKGDLTEFGASFSSNFSADGEGTITIDIPEGVEDRAEYIKEKYGKALVCLNELENRVKTDYENEIKGDIENVASMIEVL